MEILVAYDGTNASKEALTLGMKHNKAFGGKLHVVHSMVGGKDVPRRDFEKAERDLEEARILLDENKISCETHLLVRGLKAGEDITTYARERDIEMIVVGVKRRSKVGKMVFGSSAQFIVLFAPCPVLTVK